MTDIQAEINAKEKCQEQLNIIFQNAQILSGDTTPYTSDYLTQLQNAIDSAWTQCSKIALSMLQHKSLSVPKPLDINGMINIGIIPQAIKVPEIIEQLQ